MAAVWTEKAIEILKRDYPRKGVEIPELLAHGFTPKAIRTRASILGVRKLRLLWMPEDIEILTAKYEVHGSDIQELLDRGFTDLQIHEKARGLGIGMDSSSSRKCVRWTPEEDEIIRQEYPTAGTAITSLLDKGRTRASIFARARAIGVVWNTTRVMEITYSGIQYKTATDACKAAGIDVRSFYCASNRMKEDYTPQEIFDYVRTELTLYNRWSESDIKLLQENYKDKGADIPELLKKYSASAIRSKAANLGLKHVEFGSVRFQGKDVSMRTVERFYNLQHGIVSYAARHGISRQQLVDRFERMHIAVNGNQIRTVESFTRPFKDYIQCDEKLWSPTIYKKWYSPLWEPEQLMHVKRKYKLTAQQALDYLEGRLSLDTSANKAAERISHTGRNSNIKGTAFGYQGLDGRNYYFVQCSKCNRIQIIPDSALPLFVHNDLVCRLREVPAGIQLPKSLAYN